jgi:hypothetical protein
MLDDRRPRGQTTTDDRQCEVAICCWEFVVVTIAEPNKPIVERPPSCSTLRKAPTENMSDRRKVSGLFAFTCKGKWNLFVDDAPGSLNRIFSFSFTVVRCPCEGSDSTSHREDGGRTGRKEEGNGRSKSTHAVSPKPQTQSSLTL